MHRSWRTVRLVALVLSFAAQTFLAWGNTFDGPDAITYLSIAQRINGPVDLLSPDLGDDRYWAIGYPVFLSMLGAAPSQNLFLVAIAQSLMVLSMGLMAYLILRPISDAMATCTLLVVVFSPTLFVAAQTIGYEVLLGFLVTWAFTALWVANRTQGRGALIGLTLSGGLTLGLAIAVQAKVLILIPVFALVVLTGPSAGRFVRLLGFASGWLIITTALTARNGAAFGQWSPMTTNGPINIWLGNNPESTGSYHWVQPPVGWEASLFGLVADYAQSQPDDFIVLQLDKARELLLPWYLSSPVGQPLVEAAFFALQWVWVLAMTLAFGLFLASLVLRIKDPIDKLWPVALTAVIGLAASVPFITERRMRVPFEPLILTVAVPAVWLVWRLWRSTDTTGLTEGQASRSLDG